MLINCTFKLAYTCNTFSRNIDFNYSTKNLKEIVKNDVLSHMNISNFNIILAGTEYGEENDPLDCTIDNVVLYSIIPLYSDTCAFYIKESSRELDNHSILLNHTDDCPVCYCNLRPIETITLGCNHQICRNCISQWFRTGATTCPYCRS
jgi:hypothetical protein